MNLSNQEFAKMKREAIVSLEETNRRSENNNKPPPKNSSPKGNLLGSLLSGNIFEGDGLILLVLLFLLIKEGAEKEIILALVYILI